MQPTPNEYVREFSHRLSRLAILLPVILLQATSTFAAVSYEAPKAIGSGSTMPTVIVSGQITSQDVADFKKFIDIATSESKYRNQLGDKLTVVKLNSKGGSVQAAMQIGREVRKSSGAVYVTQKDVCISACVLILAGGKSRNVYGSVGIHRPYVSDDPVDTAKGQEVVYKGIEVQIKEYLTSMNVPTSLYDTMFRIPPEKVRYLNNRELQEFNLNENDPYYQSALDTKEAQNMGLTKGQYVQWKAEQTKCHQLPEEKYLACAARIAERIRNLPPH